MDDFHATYKQQFAKIMSNQMLDMDTEIKVAHQIMDTDGIIRTTADRNIVGVEYI